MEDEAVIRCVSADHNRGTPEQLLEQSAELVQYRKVVAALMWPVETVQRGAGGMCPVGAADMQMLAKVIYRSTAIRQQSPSPKSDWQGPGNMRMSTNRIV